MTLPNCYWCGRFVGWTKPYVVWTNFGSVLDLEPPDDIYAHKRCWNSHHEDHEMLSRWTWHPPSFINEELE